MKKSLIMAFVCQPYLAVIQKQLYLKYWKDEIDEVLINVNGRNDKIRKFIIDLWKEDKVKFIDEVPSEIRQGLAFDRLLPYVKGDILITMDSDNFILERGVLSDYCNLLKEYDSIGSLGYHAYPNEVSKICLEKYGTVRLNPFMSFWKMSIIQEMIIENGVFLFGTYNYKEGEIFSPIGKIPKKGWMDIMAKMSLLYFEKCPKYLPIKQSLEKSHIHIGAISSLYRSNYRSLEDTNTQKYTVGRAYKQQPYFYAWYDYIYKIAKDEVDEDYNKEFELATKFQKEYNKIDLKSINELKEVLKKQYPL